MLVKTACLFFDLNLSNTPSLSGLPVGLVVEYYLNSNDAVSQNNVLPNAFKIRLPISKLFLQES
jgi:hypothetical protein